MKKYYKKTLGVLLAMVFFFTMVFLANASENTPEQEIDDVSSEVMMSVSGYVNDNYQIEGDDGLIYEIEEGKVGDELVQLVGENVSVKGRVFEEAGANFMSVTSFKIISE